MMSLKTGIRYPGIPEGRLPKSTLAKDEEMRIRPRVNGPGNSSGWLCTFRFVLSSTQAPSSARLMLSRSFRGPFRFRLCLEGY